MKTNDSHYLTTSPIGITVWDGQILDYDIAI